MTDASADAAAPWDAAPDALAQMWSQYMTDEVLNTWVQGPGGFRAAAGSAGRRDLGSAPRRSTLWVCRTRWHRQGVCRGSFAVAVEMVDEGCFYVEIAVEPGSSITTSSASPRLQVRRSWSPGRRSVRAAIDGEGNFGFVAPSTCGVLSLPAYRWKMAACAGC